MNFANLQALTRFYVHELTARKASPSVVQLILNEGALDVASRLQCISRIQEFDAVADDGEYDLNVELTRYLGIRKEGIWWYDGTQWQELIPKSVEYMNNKFPHWRDSDSGDPQRYALFGGLFLPHPAPDTAGSSLFKAHFFQRPPAMSANAHFPFPVGTTQSGTERSDLSILSSCIILYAQWKILDGMNKRSEASEKEKEYNNDLERKRLMIDSRPDIGQDKRSKFRGPRVN